MKLRSCCAILLLSASFTASAIAAESANITVDLKHQGPVVSPHLYGIFFEEINHAGDGGLYAELVRNRGFEDANLPPACRREGNFIVPPRTPHFWKKLEASDWKMEWKVDSEYPGWTTEATGGSNAEFKIVEAHALNPATPHSLQITIREVKSAGRVAVINGGYWGIAIRGGEKYNLSFFLRGSGVPVPVIATLESVDGKELARSEFKTKGSGEWEKYDAVLRATATDPKARLALSFPSKGQVWLDFVSLFPAKDLSQPAKWTPSRPGADDCRPQARVHSVSRRMFCGRNHH